MIVHMRDIRLRTEDQTADTEVTWSVGSISATLRFATRAIITAISRRSKKACETGRHQTERTMLPKHIIGMMTTIS